MFIYIQKLQLCGSACKIKNKQISRSFAYHEPQITNHSQTCCVCKMKSLLYLQWHQKDSFRELHRRDSDCEEIINWLSSHYKLCFQQYSKVTIVKMINEQLLLLLLPPLNSSLPGGAFNSNSTLFTISLSLTLSLSHSDNIALCLNNKCLLCLILIRGFWWWVAVVVVLFICVTQTSD